MRVLTRVALGFSVLAIGLLGACVPYPTSSSGTTNNPGASGTPRPYNAVQREFQNPSPAR
ncbi:MAG: hypothetical protein JO069_05695 [Verrucomicrobia bacterium]|nr:hypothetical protein [Verrucomicrobiota bacterium]